MPIYGTAILAACLLLGTGLGRLLGALLGVDADVGGVGIAMLLLVLGCGWLHSKGRLKPPSESGITFWAQIYVPVVVAMAATQDVLGALSGGLMALLAGCAAVAGSFLLVAALARMERRPTPKEEDAA